LIQQSKNTILAGWNFGLNPWQFTTTASTNVAANQYTADQTIVIQQNYVASATGNNVAVGQGSLADNYGFTITAVTATNQFGIVQYIDPTTIRPYWSYTLSSLVKARLNSTHATSIQVKMRLFWKAGLPSATSQTVPVSSWTDGSDPTFSSADGWTAIVPNNDPAYTLANTTAYQILTFEGMTLPASTNANMTLGIMLYTVGHMNQSATADYLVIDDVSLVPNLIACSSNVLTFNETLARCQFYYQKSYAWNVLPGTTSTTGYASFGVQVAAGGTSNAAGPYVRFPITLRAIPSNGQIVLYSPSDGSAQIFSSSGSNWSSSAVGSNSNTGFDTTGTPPGGSSAGTFSQVNWTANARLG